MYYCKHSDTLSKEIDVTNAYLVSRDFLEKGKCLVGQLEVNNLKLTFLWQVRFLCLTVLMIMARLIGLVQYCHWEQTMEKSVCLVKSFISFHRQKVSLFSCLWAVNWLQWLKLQVFCLFILWQALAPVSYIWTQGIKLNSLDVLLTTL